MTPHRLAMHWGSLKVVAQFPVQSEASLQLAAALSELSCTLPSSGPAATTRYINSVRTYYHTCWTFFFGSWKCSHNVLPINWTVKITCNPPECYRGVAPACQGRYPSPRPARVLLVSSRARYGAAGNSHRKELGWLCYHCPPCAQGDALEGPPNMWGIVSTAEPYHLLLKVHSTYFYISTLTHYSDNSQSPRNQEDQRGVGEYLQPELHPANTAGSY